MPATPYHVAQSFKEGRSDKAGNFRCTANELWSYGKLLAYRVQGEEGFRWHIDPDNPPKISVTTSRHINAALHVLHHGVE